MSVVIMCPSCNHSVTTDRRAHIGAPVYQECRRDQTLSRLRVFCANCKNAPVWHNIYGIKAWKLSVAIGLMSQYVEPTQEARDDLGKWMKRMGYDISRLGKEMPASEIDDATIDAVVNSYLEELDHLTSESIPAR